MKKILFLAVLLFMLGILSGCGSDEQPATRIEQKLPDKIVIQAPPAPPTAPLLKMLDNKPFGEQVATEVIFYKTVEEATARVIKGEADFTILPLNTAAKLYNKKVDISLANVTTWGILYLISSDPTVTDWQSLKGKEVYVGAQGASPDILTRYLLEQNKVSNAALKYANSPEIAQMLIQGLATTAVLPEPLVTNVLTKKPAVKVVMDYQKAWQQVAGNQNGLPQAGMIVQNKFVQTYPGALATFQRAYQEAFDQTLKAPATVAPLVTEKFNIPAPVFEKSMTRSNVKFVQAQDAKADVDNYLSKLLKFSPEIVGGQLPDEKFYLAK